MPTQDGNLSLAPAPAPGGRAGGLEQDMATDKGPSHGHLPVLGMEARSKQNYNPLLNPTEGQHVFRGAGVPR